jgi:hypothetical protein
MMVEIMSTSVLRKIGLVRRGGPECPSELALDRMLFGETSDDAARVHVGDCGRCRVRVADRDRPIAPDARRRMLGAIERGLAERRAVGWLDRVVQLAAGAAGAGAHFSFLARLGPRRDFLTRPSGSASPNLARFRSQFASGARSEPKASEAGWSGFAGPGPGGFLGPARHLALIAVAASAVLFLVPDRDGAVRRKGAGLTMSVYRERGGQVEEALSGDAFAAGDRLRFEVELPHPGQLMIVGVERDGAVFRCYPPADDRSIRDEEVSRHVLAGAIQLDGSRGREEIHAILCDQPFSIDDVEVRSGRVVAPRNCTTAPFILDKGKR